MLLSREPRIIAFFDILGNKRIPTQQKQHRLRYPSLVLGVEYYKVMSNTFRSIVRACLPTTATTSHLRTRRPLGETHRHHLSVATTIRRCCPFIVPYHQRIVIDPFFLININNEDYYNDNHFSSLLLLSFLLVPERARSTTTSFPHQ